MDSKSINTQIEESLTKSDWKYTLSEKNDTKFYSLKFRNELTNKKEVVYEIDILPSEVLGSVKLYCLSFLDVNIDKLDQVKHFINELNKATLFGALFYDVAETEININYKHTLSLNRGNQELTVEELKDIISYIGFIVEFCYDNLVTKNEK